MVGRHQRRGQHDRLARAVARRNRGRRGKPSAVDLARYRRSRIERCAVGADRGARSRRVRAAITSRCRRRSSDRGIPRDVCSGIALTMARGGASLGAVDARRHHDAQAGGHLWRRRKRPLDRSRERQRDQLAAIGRRHRRARRGNARDPRRDERLRHARRPTRSSRRAPRRPRGRHHEVLRSTRGERSRRPSAAPHHQRVRSTSRRELVGRVRSRPRWRTVRRRARSARPPSGGGAGA